MSTQINSTDTMMASVTMHGNTLATIRSNGFTSVGEVLRALLCSIGCTIGMVEVEMRNASQGWAQRRNLFIGRQAPGRQLTLF